MRLTASELTALAAAAEARARELDEQARRAKQLRLHVLADSASIKAARCRKLAREARRRARYRAGERTDTPEVSDEYRRLMETP